MIRGFWKAVPLRVKILVGVLAFVLLWAIGMSLDSQDSSGSVSALYGDDAPRAAWRKELTDGAKAFYGEDWKPSKSDRRTIDAMASEAAKTYGAPRDDGDD
jgi:N-acetyl-beta-hexosaminidase